MELTKYKTTLLDKIIIVIASPIIFLAYTISFIIGILWGWIYSGFVSGNNVAQKITGYETYEQIKKRIIKQNQQGSKDGR